MQYIIHIVDRLSLGGVTTFIKNLSIRQRENHKVSILTIEDDRNDDLIPVKIIIENNIVIYRLNLHKFNPLTVFKLIPFIEKNDIIHVHLFPALYWVGISSIFKRNKKFFFSEHIFESKRRNKILRPIEKLIYNRYNKIIGVSEIVSLELNKWIKLPRKTIFINNGIDLNTKKIIKNREILQQHSGKKLIIMAARIGPPKNQSTLIKAFSHLDNSYHLLLAGDGPQIDEMRQLSHELKLNDNVSFLGIRNDVLSLMKTCDLSVLSTYSEGFGLGIMESFSVGTPCLASNIKVLRSILKNDLILFDTENDKELAHKIQTIIENKNIHNELVEYGNSLVKEYSIEKMVKKYSKLYEYK